jgi:hypothetical protein
MTVAIVDATPEGIPDMARCECGAVWVRPAGDRTAETLPLFALDHRHDDGGRAAGVVVPLERCKQSGVLIPFRDAGERIPCPLCGRLVEIDADWRWPVHPRPPRRCPACDGTGTDPLGDLPCPSCAGYGTHLDRRRP